MSDVMPTLDDLRLLFEDAIDAAMTCGAAWAATPVNMDEAKAALHRTGKTQMAFTAALEAALAAAPRPAEEADTLEKAIAECEAKGWLWGALKSFRGGYAGSVAHNGGAWHGHGESPLAALRAAMADAEEGQA